ncbi:MAG: hypothetical protein Q7V17_19270 [Afipia sp.]|nr:hypothetical protein [Afipia sp.]
MTDLIRLVQSWLWPATAEISTEAQDTTSMADLVRLLGTEHEPVAPADGQGEGQANEADRSGP